MNKCFQKVPPKELTLGFNTRLGVFVSFNINNDDFEPIPAPKSGDWLAEYLEPGQTYDDYVEAKPNKPDKHRNRIYLQPLGEFPEGKSSQVETL